MTVEAASVGKTGFPCLKINQPKIPLTHAGKRINMPTGVSRISLLAFRGMLGRGHFLSPKTFFKQDIN